MDSVGRGGCPGMLPGGRAGPGGDPRAGDAGDFRRRGAGERVELQEVPGDDEPEDAADGQRGPQSASSPLMARLSCGPLVQECAHLAAASGAVSIDRTRPWSPAAGQRAGRPARHAGGPRSRQGLLPQLDGAVEEGGLRPVVLHHQGRVDLRRAGDAADRGRLQAVLAEFRARRLEDALRGGCPPGGPACFARSQPTLPLLSETCIVGSTSDE